MTKKFQIMRLATGPTIAKPYTLGAVELRPASCDLPAEKQALNASRAAFGRITEEDEINPSQLDHAIRISIIVSEKNTRAAMPLAEERLEEALDALEVTAIIGKYNLQEIGYVRDMDTAHLEAIRPLEKSNYNPLRNILRVQNEDLFPMALEQLLIDKEAPGRDKIELADRLLRASHWSRKARQEANPQLRILFRWFAIESIWKFEEDGINNKNEDSVAPTRWALGFPNGPGARMVKHKTTAISQAVASYFTWDARIDKLLDNMRKFRNSSVHNGFRFYDTPVDKLKSYDHLSYLACQATQTAIERALHLGFKHPREVIEYLPLLFEQYVETHHVANLINSFEHPEGFVHHVQPDWNIG